MSRTRQHDLIAALSLALLPALVFPDVLFFGFGFFQRDLQRFAIPNASVFREIVRAGEFPYWNPFVSGGQPLAANPNYGVFYPPNWLVLLPDFNRAFQAVLLLHVSIALVGMYAFLRSIRLRLPSSTFGAISFGLSGFLLSYLNVTNFLFAIAWIPFILLFSVRAIRQPNVRDGALAALFIGLQMIVGEPTTLLQTILVVIAFGIYDVWSARRSLGESMRRAGVTAAIIGVAFCVGAVQLVPALDHLRDTERARGLQFDMVRAWSMPPLRPLELLLPEVFGHRQEGGLFYWGSRNYSPPSAPFVLDLYIGIAAILLGIAGAIRRVRGAFPLLLLCIFAYLVAIGDHTPVLRWLYDDGLFRSIRYPEKFILTAIVSLIVLGSITLDRTLAGEAKLARALWILSGAMTAASALGFVIALLPGYPVWFANIWDLADPARAATLAAISRADWMQAVVRSAMVMLLSLWLVKRGTSRLWYSAALVFLLFDLCLARGRILERVPPSFFEPPELAAEVRRATAGARLLHEPAIANAVFGQAIPVGGNARYWAAREALFPRIPATHGIATVYDGDYDLANLGPTRNLFDAFVANWTLRGSSPAEVFLAIANVGAVIDREWGGHRLRLSTRAYPRYYFADQIVQIRDLPDFIRRTTEKTWSPGVAFIGGAPFVPAKGEVMAVAERSAGVRIETRSAGRGLLVMSVTPHRYWRVRIDGRDVQPIAANIGFQGLLMDAGAHVVELDYVNPLIAGSGLVSALTIAAILASITFGPRRRLATPTAAGGA